MWRFKRTFIRPLLLALLLVMGPMHAQIVFACTMMDMAVQGECDCCDHENGKPCVDSDCDIAVDSDDDPCCEQSVELGFDDGNLRRMIFSDNLQQSTLIALFDLQVNQHIPGDHFQFTPPRDVDLVGVPIVADARPTE